MRARTYWLAGPAAVLLMSACSSSGNAGTETSTAPSAVPSSPAVSTTGVHCPDGGAAAEWPEQAPAGLPRPPGLAIVSVQREPNAVIRFTVPDDFHATVRYLLDALPAAGFSLGTGDSEAEEADIPFSKGSVHASIKVNDSGHCETAGLLGTDSD